MDMNIPAEGVTLLTQTWQKFTWKTAVRNYSTLVIWATGTMPFPSTDTLLVEQLKQSRTVSGKPYVWFWDNIIQYSTYCVFLLINFCRKRLHGHQKRLCSVKVCTDDVSLVCWDVFIAFHKQFHCRIVSKCLTLLAIFHLNHMLQATYP